MQDPAYAIQELVRVAEKGCRLALVRPIDAWGNYPIQAKYDPNSLSSSKLLAYFQVFLLLANMACKSNF